MRPRLLRSSLTLQCRPGASVLGRSRPLAAPLAPEPVRLAPEPVVVGSGRRQGASARILLLAGLCASALAACTDDEAQVLADVGRADAGRNPGDASADARTDLDADVAVPPGLVAVPGELPALVLGVWRGEGDEVWFAGGEQGPNGGLLARFDGAQVVRVPAPPGPTLWWVFGVDDQRWASGEAGRVLRAPAGGVGPWTAETTDLPDTAVLWGLWGANDHDLWAVGGSPRPDGPKGLALRSTGDGRWTRVVDAALPEAQNLYKVWGSGPNDVHLVGEGGVALHWDGAALTRVPTPTEDLLFTVHGQPGGPVLAVGGISAGIVLRFEGDRWVDDDAPPVPALNGVFVAPDGTAIATGARGLVLLRDAAGTWTRQRLMLDADAADDTLHAVTLGATDVWAVGGDFATVDRGLILTTHRPLPSVAWTAAPEPPAPDLGVDLGGLADAGLDAEADMDLVGGPDAEPDFAPPDLAIDAALPEDLAVPVDAAGVCGDGVRNPGEACDDGANLPGDGCDPECALECGNGRLDLGETCDDGAREGGDGCDAQCQLECGNGVVEAGETCDDRGRANGDGCDARCQLECGNNRLDPGEQCDLGDREPGDGCDAQCQFECGNGRLDPNETCDDANRLPGDGCDRSCRLECGNGQLEGLEGCDDGNLEPGDGCDATCHRELPGPGQTCPDFQCSASLNCWGIAQAGFRNICTQNCATVDECGVYGPACCQPPGPQVIQKVCVPLALLPNGCN